MHHTLYFVGAGMSRALARPELPIPLMWDFVSVMSRYVDDDIILTTLAELENAEPYPYEWPWEPARKLASELVGMRCERSPERRRQFGEALRARPAESIEDILERCSLTGANMSAQGAEGRFLFAIARLFCLIGWNVNDEALVQFLEHRFALKDTTHRFVSFNYDLLLEHAIEKCVGPRWDPAVDYGVPFDHWLESDPVESPARAGTMQPAQASRLEPSRASDGTVTVLKPHSSLNWIRLGGSGPGGEATESLVLPLTSDRKIRYYCSTHPWQFIQTPSELPRAADLRIVQPTSRKRVDQDLLQAVHERERQYLNEADEVLVLGWSMPDSDSDQNELIRSTISGRHNPLEWVTVVNKGAT